VIAVQSITVKAKLNIKKEVAKKETGAVTRAKPKHIKAEIAVAVITEYIGLEVLPIHSIFLSQKATTALAVGHRKFNASHKDIDDEYIILSPYFQNIKLYMDSTRIVYSLSYFLPLFSSFLLSFFSL
jgi:hypothetical protein